MTAHRRGQRRSAGHALDGAGRLQGRDWLTDHTSLLISALLLPVLALLVLYGITFAV